MKFSFAIVFTLFALLTKAEVYMLFEENGKKGVKNEKGEVIIPASFEALGWSDGSFSVIGNVTGYRAKEQWGIINLQKQFLTPAEFESLEYGGGDNIVARKKVSAIAVKTGTLDLQGRIKIPFAYDGIQISGLRAIVFNLTGSKFSFGLTDLQNKLLLPLVHKNIFSLGTLRFGVQNTAGKMALYSDDGKPVTDFSIDSISSFYKGYAIVYEGLLQGLMDREGQIKLNPVYQSIKVDQDGRVFAQLPSECIWLNNKNEVVKKIYADDITVAYRGLQLITRGDMQGVVDANFSAVIPIEYQSLTASNEYFMATKKNKTGLISAENKILIDFQYDSLVAIGKNYFAFTKLIGWQIIDARGKVLTDKYYQSLTSAHTSIISRHQNFYGLINEDGKEILHCVFDSIQQVREGLVAVKFKGQYGIMDLQQNWLVAPQAYPIQIVNATRYVLRQPGNSFLKTLSGEIIYFTPYATKFDDEHWWELLPDGDKRKISYDGTILPMPAPPQLKQVQVVFSESEGLRGVQKDGKFGFIDEKGKLRIANRYDSIQNFHEGLAAIKLIGKWGFINTHDEIVVHPNYQTVSAFKNGICVVKQNGRYGAINKLGQLVLPLRYDELNYTLSKKIEIITDHKKGRASLAGSIEIEPRFDSLHEAGEGYLIAEQQGNFGVITEHGLSIIPLIYNRISFNSTTQLYTAWKKNEMKLMTFN